MKEKRIKRVLALVCVAVLIASCVITLVTAIVASNKSGEVFMAAVAANIILPVMMWIYLQTAKYFEKKGKSIREGGNDHEK